MNFTTCNISGHLKASGSKGEYWIVAFGWIYLQRVTPNHSGPEIEALGTFNSIEDAIKEAELLDGQAEGE